MNDRAKYIFAFVTTFILFFLVLPIIIVTFYGGLEKLLPLSYIASPWHWVLSGAAFAMGWYWMIWSNIYIFKIGKGTSLEVAGHVVNPTQKLLTTGPYIYCRNPMAFGFVIAFVTGIGFLLGSLWTIIITPLSFLALGAYERQWEEKGLEKRFGNDYRQYRASTPMFIPRIWRGDLRSQS